MTLHPGADPSVRASPFSPNSAISYLTLESPNSPTLSPALTDSGKATEARKRQLASVQTPIVLPEWMSRSPCSISRALIALSLQRRGSTLLTGPLSAVVFPARTDCRDVRAVRG
jgi:hypothetical protein